MNTPEHGSSDSMSDDQRAAAAWSQLNLVLDFYSRIDTKAAVVLGLDLGMIAVLSARMEHVLNDGPAWIWCLLFACLALIVVSCFHLYLCTVPDRKGGTNSLIFFGTIAKLSESEFLKACRDRSHKELIDDLLGQTWRNSKILRRKFDGLEQAYRFMIAAAAPWTVALFVAMKATAAAQ